MLPKPDPEKTLFHTNTIHFISAIKLNGVKSQGASGGIDKFSIYGHIGGEIAVFFYIMMQLLWIRGGWAWGLFSSAFSLTVFYTFSQI